MAAFDLIIEGTTVVTCDTGMRVVRDGALGVVGGLIAAIGRTADFAGAPAGERIDGRDSILMPGLVNTHCHLASTLFRGLVEDLPLEPWLATVWKAERAILDPATCHLGARLGLAELALAGVTAVMDNFWHVEETVGAARRIGLRLSTGGIFFDAPGMDGKDASLRQAEAEAFLRAHAGEAMLMPAVMPHGTYTVGPQALRVARDVARAHGALFSIHAAETRAEQATVTERYGHSVIRHLAALDCLGPRTVLAHCVHVDAGEIALLAETGTHVAHNPVSNLKLASGFAPVPAMLAAGVPVTLGTDGAVSGNDLDPWLALRLAATLHKAATGDATVMPVAEVLRMATINGARALGIGERAGSLEVGKEADLLLVTTGRLHAVPLFDPAAHLVYAAGRGDVTDVFVAGRSIVRGGRLVTDDAEAIRAEVAALAPRVAASVAG